MSLKLKPAGKLLLIAIVVTGGVLSIRWYQARPKEAVNGGTRITWERMAWNAQFSGMYANGGVRTTKGSLFDKAHLAVSYQRQDDCNKQMADLVKFAGEYKTNPNRPGVLITFMGDGMPAFMPSLSKELEPLG